MSEVEKAEQTLAELERKRKALVESRAADAGARRAVAFKAHAGGDKGGRAALDKLADAAARFDSELRSLDDAVATAQDHLLAARAAAAQAADRERALALRACLAEVTECAVSLDEALVAVAAEGSLLLETVSKMHTLGTSYPSHEQVRVLGTKAILSALAATPWRREFQTLAPNERRNIRELVQGWVTTIERDVCARLGEFEQTTNEAA